MSGATTMAPAGMGTASPTPGFIPRGIGRPMMHAMARMLCGKMGTLSEEAIFALMCDVMTTQSEMIKTKATFFKEQTLLQRKYSEYRRLMQKAQSCATESNGKFLNEADLAAMELDADQIAAVMEIGRPNITPEEFATYLNDTLFGSDPRLSVAVPEYDSSANPDATFSDLAKFQTHVLDKIEAAQSANCADTTLLTSELQQAVSQQQRFTQMFSNILSKLHDIDMSVIRNI